MALGHDPAVKEATRKIIADIKIAANALERIRQKILGPTRERDSAVIMELRHLQHNLVCDLAVAARTLTTHTDPEKWDPFSLRGDLDMLVSRCTKELREHALIRKRARGEKSAGKG